MRSAETAPRRARASRAGARTRPAGRTPTPRACPDCRRRIEGLAGGPRTPPRPRHVRRRREPTRRRPRPRLRSRPSSRTLEEAEGLVRAAEADDDSRRRAPRGVRPSGRASPRSRSTPPSSPRGSPSRRPRAALDFAGAIRGRPRAFGGRGPPPARPRRAEGAREPGAALRWEETEDARRLALEGLSELEASGAPLLLLSRARYVLPARPSGACARYGESLPLLAAARDGFAEDGQDAWIGRSEAAIGLVHFSQARFRQALHAFDAALERLDPGGRPWTGRGRAAEPRRDLS